MDLIEKLDMKKDVYLNTQINEAGALLFLLCDETRNLVNEWYDVACDYHYIDDTPSISRNLTNFIEHRHDQSVFSLLTKKYNLFSKHNLKNCDFIRYIRNRTGTSVLKTL